MALPPELVHRHLHSVATYRFWRPHTCRRAARAHGALCDGACLGPCSLDAAADLEQIGITRVGRRIVGAVVIILAAAVLALVVGALVSAWLHHALLGLSFTLIACLTAGLIMAAPSA